MTQVLASHGHAHTERLPKGIAKEKQYEKHRLELDSDSFYFNGSEVIPMKRYADPTRSPGCLLGLLIGILAVFIFHLYEKEIGYSVIKDRD